MSEQGFFRPPSCHPDFAQSRAQKIFAAPQASEQGSGGFYRFFRVFPSSKVISVQLPGSGFKQGFSEYVNFPSTYLFFVLSFRFFRPFSPFPSIFPSMSRALALYLNIPHDEGIKAVVDRCYSQNTDSDKVPIPPQTMQDLLGIVLKHNYFQFSDCMYHQVQGTAMGTRMAPAYANIFMANLEEKLLEGYTTDPYLWKRYIDDVLCIWPGTPQSLKNFMDYLNRSHRTIKFTYEYSTTSIDFLDITIYKGVRYATTGKLDVKPFFKHTNKFQYLEYSSAHPPNTFKSLIKGELVRLLRACSDKQTYDEVIRKMSTIFRDRGYPKSLVRLVTQTVPFSMRQLKLYPTNKSSNRYDTYLVTNYTNDLDTRRLKATLKPTQSEELHVPRPCLSLTKPKNFNSSQSQNQTEHRSTCV